jgi:C4-dicarboxylate-specific signal transduction histidine kinase
VAGEVARALNYDIEEKKIKLEVLVESVVIEADEQLLRQALFNLVLNAIQAVPPQGVIRIRASRRNNEEAFIEISDNGPGVPAEHRARFSSPTSPRTRKGPALVCRSSSRLSWPTAGRFNAWPTNPPAPSSAFPTSNSR